MGSFNRKIEAGGGASNCRSLRLRALLRAGIPVLAIVGGSVVWPAAALAAMPAQITVSFDKASIPLNTTATLTFRIDNPDPTSNLTGIGFTDTLPDGLVVAGNGVDGDCGGNVTAGNGPSLVALSNGVLTARTVCEISVDVKGTTAGSKNDSVQVTSSAGTGNTATALLQVVAPPRLSQHFGAGWFAPDGSTSLSFEIDNPNDVALTGVGFSDTLPGGLHLATPSALTGDCDGGTITAAPGDALVRLAGAALAPHGTCAFSVEISGTAPGLRNNSPDPVSSNEGGNGSAPPNHVSVIARGDRIFWTSQVSGSLSVADLAPGGGGGYVNLAASHTALGIVLDPAAGRIYWADPAANKISFANLDGSGVGDLNTTGATVDQPHGLAIDPVARVIYWANVLGGKISFANLNGSGGGDLNTTGATVTFPDAVAIDPAGGRVYWANLVGKISYARLNGTGGADLDTSGATVNVPQAVAVDAAAGRIYWANSGANSIAYADLGGAAHDLPISGVPVNEPIGLAIDHAAGKLYWGNEASSAIDVANLDGSDARRVDTTGGSLFDGYLALLQVPSGTDTPTVMGGPAPGSTLICSPGGWAADDTGSFLYRAPQGFAYQWSLNGGDIAGATSATYAAPVPGTYRCRVTASNAAGATAQTSAPHAVLAPTGSNSPLSTVPRIWALHETNSVFAVGGTSTPLTATTAARRRKRSTVFSFRLDQAATVAIVIERLQAGRLVGRGCKPDRHSLRGQHRCLRAVTVATLRRSAHAGRNRVTFTGRIGRRTLSPGRYSAVFTATDGAGSSRAEALPFRIVKR